MPKMGGRVKNTPATRRISNKLGNIKSFDYPEDLRNIPVFVEEIGKIFLIDPKYFNYHLRKRNNSLTEYDLILKQSSERLQNCKQDPEAMKKIDDLISKFMVLCKRNTSKEIASNFSTANVTAEDLISWLQG